MPRVKLDQLVTKEEKKKATKEVGGRRLVGWFGIFFFFISLPPSPNFLH